MYKYDLGQTVVVVAYFSCFSLSESGESSRECERERKRECERGRRLLCVIPPPVAWIGSSRSLSCSSNPVHPLLIVTIRVHLSPCVHSIPVFCSKDSYTRLWPRVESD